MKSSKYRVAALGGVVIASLTLSACAGSAVGGGGAETAGEDIVIGSLHPLSGANAVDGQQMSNAAQMAVDAVNAAGGIASMGGAQLVLEEADTQGAPEVGQSEATRLVQEGAVALVGSYQSATSANIAAVAERNQVPFVMDVSALDAILEQEYQYSFRIQPSGSIMGAQGVQNLVAMAEESGAEVDQVAFLYEQSNFGSSVHAAFAEEAEAAGITVEPAISYDAASVSDLSTQIQQVAASGADVLAVAGYYRDSLLVSQAVESIKPDLQAVYGVANGGYDTPQFVADAPNGGEGYFDANYHWDVTDEDAQALAAAYEEEFGDPIRTSAVLTYDAVMLIAQALEDAGSSDSAALRDAIAGISYDPLVVNDGPVEFDETGQNVNASVVVMQVVDGAVRQVFPAELAETDYRFPAPVTE